MMDEHGGVIRRGGLALVYTPAGPILTGPAGEIRRASITHVEQSIPLPDFDFSLAVEQDMAAFPEPGEDA